MTGDFWRSAGFHLTHRDAVGRVAVTPDLVRAYLTRPEVHPVEESCEAEHRLFEALMADPFRPVSAAELAAIADADAADNYRIVLAFRDRLVAAGSVDAAYAGLFGEAPQSLPPVFLDQMVHLIVRNLLAGESDALRLRAAELFFREQRVSEEDGRILLADAEFVAMRAASPEGGQAALLAGAPAPRTVTLDLLTEHDGAEYRRRSDRFDTAVDFRFAEPAQDAFARVLEAWIGHFHALPVRIQPMQAIRDERWSWHVGLDAEATHLLNALYRGAPAAASDRMVALFRLECLDPGAFIDTMVGKPVYLGLAMTPARLIKMKPQNLLANLPLRRQE